MKKPKKREKEFEPFEIEAVSGTDCTGLISRAAHSKEEWEGYDEIVHFAPPHEK